MSSSRRAFGGGFGGLFALWLLLVGTFASTELIAGVCAAAIGAAAITGLLAVLTR